MEVVVDVNVILSSLLGKGDSSKVFSLNFLFNKFDFIAPEFLLIELEKHRDEIRVRSNLSDEDFDDALEFILEQITFVPKSQFEDKLEEAEKFLSKHLKDVQYLALALKLDCPIFSGDKELKELSPVEVFSPKEMLKRL